MANKKTYSLADKVFDLLDYEGSFKVIKWNGQRATTVAKYEYLTKKEADLLAKLEAKKIAARRKACEQLLALKGVSNG